VLSTGWADTDASESVWSRRRRSANTINCCVISYLTPHASTGNEGASAFGRAALGASFATERSTGPAPSRLPRAADFKIPKQMSA
jgi:hypothetical protein